jgi:CheY-like chemotaxis protein
MNSTSKVSVLVVDDHPRSLEFVSSALRSDGVEVLTSSDPEEALETIYSVRPQVVLTDLVMPRAPATIWINPSKSASCGSVSDAS